MGGRTEQLRELPTHGVKRLFPISTDGPERESNCGEVGSGDEQQQARSKTRQGQGRTGGKKM